MSELYCAAAGPQADHRRGQLLAMTAELRQANYAVDAQAAARLVEEFRAMALDPRQPNRWLAHYQAGTASSLLAGFVGPGSLSNPKGDVPLMLRHMEDAAKSFEAAVALAPDFADAHAALANTCGYRSAFEPQRAAELVARAKRARDRSLAVGPRNPRVVAGHAGFLFWAPPQAGGNRELGLERYREALELFASEKPSDREVHAWGEPDTWAFLAMARLSLDPPDARGAKAALDRALAPPPGFSVGAWFPAAPHRESSGRRRFAAYRA